MSDSDQSYYHIPPTAQLPADQMEIFNTATSATKAGFGRFFATASDRFRAHHPLILEDWKRDAMSQAGILAARILSQSKNPQAFSDRTIIDISVRDYGSDMWFASPDAETLVIPIQATVHLQSEEERFSGLLSIHSPTLNVVNTLKSFPTKHRFSAEASDQISKGLVSNIDETMSRLNLARYKGDNGHICDSRFGWRSDMDSPPYYHGQKDNPTVHVRLIGSLRVTREDGTVISLNRDGVLVSATSSVPLFPEGDTRNDETRYSGANYPLFFTVQPYEQSKA